jgi:hypothetical protein
MKPEVPSKPLSVVSSSKGKAPRKEDVGRQSGLSERRAAAAFSGMHQYLVECTNQVQKNYHADWDA